MTQGLTTASLVAALLAGVSSPTLAATSDAEPGAAAASASAASTAAADQTIVVTGQRGEYGAKKTSTATKTNTDIRNIPQALTVISEKQIEDQSIRSVAELLTFVPGATPGTGESNRDQFTLRGNNTTADFFIDGVRDDAQYFRDFYNVERVEVLKGPNAMIFGRGGGGGIVNRVTKRASFGEYREALTSTDSFGGLRLAGDFDHALGSGVAFRLNGLFENGDSFRRHVDLKRYGVNPTLAFQAGPNTRIDVGYEYFHDRRTADRGVPANGARPLEGHDRDFFGDPDESFAKANVNIGTFALEHELADGLTVKNRTTFADYDKFYQNIYPSSFNATTGLVTLGAYNNRNDRQNLFSQTDLVWENRLGGIEQTLLFGFEVGRQKSVNHRMTGTFLNGTTTPVTDPTVDKNVRFASSASDANNRTRATVTAIYVQDQIRPTDWLEIVAGLRFDSFKLDVNDLRPASTDFSRRDELWSPRLGLILKPRDNLSIYTSFSRSYLPQSGDQFSGLTSTTAELKPERFDNYELGAKWEPIDGLLATAAVYQLDRTNTRATDPLTQQTVLTGAQRSKGVELGLERSISDRWQVSAGYSWQKAEITKTTASAPAGREVPIVPRHSFSLWNRYDVSDALGLGLGVIARSSSYASISNNVKLPSYARVDAAAYYKLMRGIEAQINVENIFGADYFPTAHSDNNIAPGAPRTIKAQLRFGF
ncbi:MAG: TonB-dependent siderophore receptor [Sphingomonas sp.]|nr:TonB-dependent siderophore receptor [Sphingomonas sp.]